MPTARSLTRDEAFHAYSRVVEAATEGAFPILIIGVEDDDHARMVPWDTFADAPTVEALEFLADYLPPLMSKPIMWALFHSEIYFSEAVFDDDAVMVRHSTQDAIGIIYRHRDTTYWSYTVPLVRDDNGVVTWAAEADRRFVDGADINAPLAAGRAEDAITKLVNS